jgi:hypothetical protein
VRRRLAGLFHWNANVAPLCRRKPATNGHRLLCAAADASSLLVHPQRQPWPKRLPSPGAAILAGAVFLAAAPLLRRADGLAASSIGAAFCLSVPWCAFGAAIMALDLVT